MAVLQLKECGCVFGILRSCLGDIKYYCDEHRPEGYTTCSFEEIRKTTLEREELDRISGSFI
jgi:hypothetical protein